jgi:hypothetical protein
LQLLRFSVLSGRITKAFASFFFPAEALWLVKPNSQQALRIRKCPQGKER